MYQNPVKIDTRLSLKSTSPNHSECKGCNICKEECAFLSRYGNPGEIEKLCHLDPEKCQEIAFECSLCGLCSALCPRHLDPSAMFLELRRQAVTGGKDLSVYKILLNYEKRGISPKYNYYHLPDNCRTVFFPGCGLTGTRPGSTLKAYEFLQEIDESTGIVLDCCTKPSHDLGRQDFFDQMFSQIKAILLENGIKNIIVACPNCYKIFDTYAGEFHLETIYDVMAREGLGGGLPFQESLSVHDPCPVRFKEQIHDSVRSLINQFGQTVEPAAHQENKTRCCGEGGSVGCVKPEWAGNWRKKITDDNSGRLIATYCAGCAHFLSKKNQVFHILDLVFDSGRTLKGKAKVSRAPFTYLNRLKLKKRLKRVPAGFQAERKPVSQPAGTLRKVTGKIYKTLGLGRLL